MISKKISYVLRHGAEKEGLKLDKNGYANCADLVCFGSSLWLSHISSIRDNDAHMYYLSLLGWSERTSIRAIV